MRAAGTTSSHITEDNIIVSTVAGYCDGSVANKTFETNLKLRSKLPPGSDVKFLLDMSGVTAVDSAARTKAKDITKTDYSRIAIVVRNPFISLAVQYVINIVHFDAKAKVFRSVHAAEAWLKGDETKRRLVSDQFAGLIAGMLVGGIGVITLIGWLIDNPYLMRMISTMRPMNPLGAVGLIILSVAMIALSRRRKRVADGAGIGLMVLGTCALLPLGIDGILFKDVALASTRYAQLADSAAICFIICGLCIQSRLDSTAWRRVKVVLVSLIYIIAGLNIFGQLYAHDYIYGLENGFVMALHLAIALTIATTALLILYDRDVKTLKRITPTGWGVFAVLIILQVATYAIWSTTIRYNQAQSANVFTDNTNNLQQTMTNRVNGYSEVLRGYGGLYSASDSVSEGDFKQYFSALELQSQYPGFKSISFVAKVPANGLSRFQAQQRQDRSYTPAGRPTFTVKRPADAATHYVIAYLGDDQASSNIGLDLASVPGRSQIFEAAAASQKAYLSGSLTITPAAGEQPREGFFIAVPVKNRGSTDYIGFVNTIFYYDVFFNQIFSENDALPNLAITDTMDGKVLYRQGSITSADSLMTFNVPVANRVWRVTAAVPQTFGNSDAQRYLPRSILVTGQLLSLLLIAIFWALYRSRQRALKLADAMTEDLYNERNSAVAIRDKDDAILSSIGDAVFAIDTAGRLTLFNPAATRLTGFTEAEAIGQPWPQVVKFIHLKDGSLNTQTIDAAAKGKITIDKTNTTLVRKDGNRLAVAISAAPISQSDGMVDGVIVIFRDISFDQQLNKAKTEFVSLASHQLRTPLSAINWYSEILLDGDAGALNDEQKNYVTEIFDGNKRMIELVNALLDASRLELGRFTNERQTVKLCEQTASIQQELSGDMTKKQLRYEASYSKDLPAVQVDPKLSRMIIQNLLSNAVKYTPAKGTITVAVRTAKPSEVKQRHLHGRNFVLLCVKDDGYGIPKIQQDKIFGKLFRADNVQTLDVEGTGLGLYLVKEIVDKLGGSVWFESVESIGTSFYVLLPVVTKES